MAAANLLQHALSGLTHKVTKNTSYQLLSKLFTGASTLIILRLLSQYYSQSGVGEFTIVVNYINIFYLIADFGLNAIIVKRMIEEPHNEKRLFQVLLGLRILACIGLLFCAIAISQLLVSLNHGHSTYTPEFFGAVVLLSVSIIFQGIYLTATSVFQKELLYSRTVIALAVGSFVSTVGFWLFAHPNTSLLLPLAGYMVGNLVTGIVALMLVPFPVRQKFLPIFSWRLSQPIIAAALPIAATLVLNIVYFRADSFILGGMISSDGVGIYGMAYKVFDQAIVLPVFFVNALYPILLHQYTNAPEKLRKTLFLSSLILLATGASLGIFVIIAAPILIWIVAGSRTAFADSILPLRILAAGLPFFFLSNLFLWLLVTLGKQKHLISIYGASMIFNITMNIVLIPHFSYLASAALTSISEAIVLALTMLYSIYFYRTKIAIPAMSVQQEQLPNPDITEMS